MQNPTLKNALMLAQKAEICRNRTCSSGFAQLRNCLARHELLKLPESRLDEDRQLIQSIISEMQTQLQQTRI